ncbi:hypothetical protein CTM53_06015 [Prevotella intermedia]|uniref:Lipoprotein n=1 Tax=Prevotella intermedia TaxID=28131 RepID=A0AAJ3RSS7_PREIN|nr:hypothetical protein CTM61_03685 [Prevotella intermedia]PJI20414.1 hypothetical protein CTM53_06015 [Prevotella intermedia]
MLPFTNRAVLRKSFRFLLIISQFTLSSFSLISCNAKAAVLHGKSVGFAAQKSRFRNAKAQLSLFKRIIFTN